MRHLVLLRGAMGAGKTTFIKELNLEQFTLSADTIRLMFQTPVQMADGKEGISPKHDGKVWGFLFQLLEERMKRGEFTVIDATHAKQEMITQYKKLAGQYRYRVTVVDFSDVPLETLLEQNRMRPEYKHVPDHVIMNSYERMQSEHVPKWVTTIKPHEFKEAMFYEPIDFSEYKRIHHIGDIHGCHTALMNYFLSTDHNFLNIDEPMLRDDELYIFVGDLLDRGIENVETLKFFLKIYDRKNVIILEGNHEHHIWRWANDEEPVSRVFEYDTQPQLDNADIDKKEVRQLYRRLRQVVYYTYHGKTVLVTHGGLAKLPDNLMYMATEQFVKGVGDYEVDIDDAWDKNVPRLPMPIYGGSGSRSFVGFERTPNTEQLYQIHGHRNIFRLPVQAGVLSFNLEGQVEFGGDLRSVILSPQGFDTVEIENKVFKPRTRDITVKEEDLNMDDFITYLSNHDEIVEKDLGDNIFSYNFSRNAFIDKIWDDINVKARGLFINKNTKEIVARSYNKFFNVGERSFTKMGALANNLVFPVDVYDKPNGYLGIVGYNSEKDELFFSSKSETRGEHAQWLRELFFKTFDLWKRDTMKEDMKQHNFSIVFEVITKNDPHIIEYKEDKLVLLDLVHREVVYEKMSYAVVKGFAQFFGCEYKEHIATFNNWTDFYKWYRVVTEDFSIQKEGFVIEDDEGFMTKIKLPYYNFWKQFRGIKDKFARKHDHMIKHGSLYTPMHNKVFAWMKKQDGKWLKDNDIITVRKKYESDINA